MVRAMRVMDKILVVLADHPEGLRSLDIGLALGRDRYDAAAYVGTALTRLVEHGAVTKKANLWIATGKPAPEPVVPGRRRKEARDEERRRASTDDAAASPDRA
jgi:hypothetical protein